MLTVSFFTNNSEHSISLMSLVFFRGSGFGVVVKEGVWLLATIREESCDVSLLSQKSAPKKTFLGVKIPTLGWKLPKKKTQSNEVSFSCKGKRPPFAFFLVWKISRLRVFFTKMDHHPHRGAHLNDQIIRNDSKSFHTQAEPHWKRNPRNNPRFVWLFSGFEAGWFASERFLREMRTFPPSVLITGFYKIRCFPTNLA